MFEIIIKRQEIVTKVEGTYQKVADTGNERDRGAVYDYVNHEVTKEIEVEVYRQKVDSLDLAQVVAVVNGITTPSMLGMTQAVLK